MVEFKALKGGVYEISSTHKDKPEAQREQKKWNRLGKPSKVIMAKHKGGERVYEVWVKS